MKLTLITFFISTLAFVSCKNNQPKPINFGKDQCDHCKMTITDARFAAELLTEKGRAYKFDDQLCMKNFEAENTDKSAKATLYISDFSTKKLIPLSKATFIEGGEISSPMSGNKAAFAQKSIAENAAKKMNATISSY